MNRSSTVFWVSVTILFCLGAFYTASVKKEIGKARGGHATIGNGAVVKLVKVVDGDTIQAVQEGEDPAIIRILGIKSFDAKIEKDVMSPYARAATESLQRTLEDRPIRVSLNSTPKDRYGRYIATLYVDDQDVGLHLVKEGLVLVYTVYTFPAMSLYLEQQDLARAKRRGFWANNDASARALTLSKAWQRRTD
jgi:endonuclease YncB( thermonuclease family)